MSEDLMVWWLHNDQSEAAHLKSGAPQYLKDQLSSRKGRNGRGRLWVDLQFGNLILPRFADNPDLQDDWLPGGIVIHSSDAKFCVGGTVRFEFLKRNDQ